MKSFGSDNHSGIHPKLLEALIKCNVDHSPSYGTDDDSDRAKAAFQKLFGPHTQVFFVFNGTASNVLALRSMMKRHQSVLCTALSHLNLDECGAPEFFAGKLIPLESVDGKLTVEILNSAIIRRGDQHFSQPQVVSLTQPTEVGTCYSLTEIKEITTWAHNHNLSVHMDGSRIANAAHFLNTTFKEMTTDLGIDVVSFGGTKNGLMMGEAILVLNPKLGDDLKYIRKQSAQLPSKTRFIAAQFTSYLNDEVYKTISAHACLMAEKLFQNLQTVKEVKTTYPRQSNAVFVTIPQRWIKILREKFFFYVWNEKTFECRLMTTWDTTEKEIDDFTDLIRKLAESK